MMNIAAEIKICTVNATIKKYVLIIKKKKKKHHKILLVEKTKWGIIEVLISQGLIDFYISLDEIVSVNNVISEYSEMKV